MNGALKEKQRIIVEDASSSTMDLDTGLYPFTDSFYTTTGAVCTGLGIPEEAIETTVGVFSAVSIVRSEFLRRIKEFPTRIRQDDPAYESIAERFESGYGIHRSKYEFGWTDLNLIRHAELINQLSSVMLTNLDVLNDVDTIKLATRYTRQGGEGQDPCIYSKSLPAKIADWEEMVPEYTELPGWNQDLSHCDRFSALPIEAQGFVRKLERASKIPVEYVSINGSADPHEGILRIVR